MPLRLDKRIKQGPPAEPVLLPAPNDEKAVRAFAATVERFELTGEGHRAIKNPHHREELPFTEAQIFLARLEYEFITEPEASLVLPPPEIKRLIGLGQMVCPDCANTMQRPIHECGAKTGVRIITRTRCPCVGYRMFFRKMEDPRNLGVDYHQVRLRTLLRYAANFSTFAKIKGRFETLVATVTAHPGNSYLLCGPAGQGKTTLLAALYANALSQWVEGCFWAGEQVDSVWIANATKLSAEFRAWEMKDDGRGSNEGPPTMPPSITIKKIENAVAAGFTPAIFIEELDKFKLDSEFQLKSFSRIIDEVHNAGGQIVATSNLNEYQLRSKLGEQYGGGLIRRIAGARGNEGTDYSYDLDGVRIQAEPDGTNGGFYIDFWKGEITQNLGSPGRNMTDSRAANALGEGNFDSATRG